MSALDESKIPLSEALTKSSMEAAHMIPLVCACVRKMLIAFDQGNYDIAARLSSVIGSFANKNGDCITAIAIALSTVTPACAQTTPELGVASHVKALIPVYKVAHANMRMSRWAGVMFQPQQFLVDFEKALSFLDMTDKATMDNHNHLRPSAISNQTRYFTFGLGTTSVFVLLVVFVGYNRSEC